MLLLLLLFLTFSVLVANPKKLLYTVANPARGLLNREKRTKEKVWQHTYGTASICCLGSAEIDFKFASPRDACLRIAHFFSSMKILHQKRKKKKSILSYY